MSGIQSAAMGSAMFPCSVVQCMGWLPWVLELPVILQNNAYSLNGPEDFDCLHVISLFHLAWDELMTNRR